MQDYIRANTQVSIPAGKIDDFKKLAAEIIAKVEATEPGTLSYEWYISDDERTCWVFHQYRDSEAALEHLRNIADLSGPLHEFAPITNLFIFGSLSEELREVLVPVGAKIFENWNGVTR